MNSVMTGGFSSNFPIYCINMRERQDKWNSIQERFQQEKLTWSEGFNIKEDPQLLETYIKRGYIRRPTQELSYGNIGGGLAHVHVWERIAIGVAPLAMILEDDARPTDRYLDGLYEIIEACPNFDMVNLVVLRPHGSDMNASGLLKVDPIEKLREPLPNVRTCAYLMSQKGALKMLALFKRYKPDLNKQIVDRTMVRLTNTAPSFERYVVKDARFFIHDGSDSDRTKKNRKIAKRRRGYR